MLLHKLLLFFLFFLCIGILKSPSNHLLYFNQQIFQCVVFSLMKSELLCLSCNSKMVYPQFLFCALFSYLKKTAKFWAKWKPCGLFLKRNFLSQWHKVSAKQIHCHSYRYKKNSKKDCGVIVGIQQNETFCGSNCLVQNVQISTETLPLEMFETGIILHLQTNTPESCVR